MSLYLLPIGKK